MNTHIRKLVYTALFAALTAVGAFLRIPMVYSSVTLQYLFTAMAGLLLGRRWGALGALLCMYFFVHRAYSFHHINNSLSIIT